MCLQLFKVVAVLVCKGSSSDLVRYEPNSIEMRCDIAWMWYPSRYYFYAALQNHSMSFQREMRCDIAWMWYPSRYYFYAALRNHSMSLQREMRCDSGLMWFPSRYIPPSAEHSMSLQLFKVVAVLVCKR
jgi:hypothetical protein